MNIKLFCIPLILCLFIKQVEMFSVQVNQIPSTDAGKTRLSPDINTINGLSVSDIHDQYMTAIGTIISAAGTLLNLILSRQSGASGMTIGDPLNSCSNYSVFGDIQRTTVTDDLVVYYVIDTTLYPYFSYFTGQPGTGVEYIHAMTCILDNINTSGYDQNRPQAGIIFFNYANIFGPNFLNGGTIYNFDSYVKLAAKALLNIMGLNINLSQYWLTSSGTVYASNPVVQSFVTAADGVPHYTITSPSLLAYAKTYFQQSSTPPYLLVGAYVHTDLMYVNLDLHIAPEEIISEVNQLPFYYVIGGFTLAAITDMGWYLVNSLYQQSLTFASSAPSTFLADVLSRSQTLNTLYPTYFGNATPNPAQCYLAYGQTDVIISRSPNLIPTGILMYKQMCQRSDGFVQQPYNSYTYSSGCFISTFPNSSTNNVCLLETCTSSNAMISVTMADAQTTCNTANNVVTGIKAFTTQSTVFSLTCPSSFSSFCSSEKPCANNCNQNGICIHNFCYCKTNYIGLYCQKLCATGQWYDAVANACVDTCPSGYYGNVSQNRQCIQCATSNCLDDCATGYYRPSGSTTCTACPSQCQTCTSATVCLTCKFGYTLTNSFCVCTIGNYNSSTNSCVSCTSSQYFDSSSNTCKSCNSSCLTCQTSATNCTSCASPNFLNNNTCVASCPSGMFGNSNQVCQSCTSPCANCSGSATYCTSCINNLTLTNGTCGCPSNGYLSTDTNTCVICTSNQIVQSGACVNCSSNCATCQTSISNCLTCYNNLTISNGACVCVNAIYVAASNSCVACNSNQILDSANNQCLTCDQKCATCQTTVSNCLTCVNNLTLSNGTCICTGNYIYQSATNSCIACSSGQYADTTNTYCLSCNVKCATCTSSTVCTSCANTLQLSNNTCTCSAGYIYDSPSNSCVQCASNAYADTVNNVCVTCDTKCKTCTTSSTNCTSCANNLTFSNNTCICGANEVYNSTSNSCITCTSSQYADTVNNICQNCNVTCSTCSTSSTNCTACANNLVLSSGQCICTGNSIYNVSTNACVACATNQYASNNICISCSTTCATCTTSSTNCTSCPNNLSLQNGSCVCTNNSIYSGATNSCISCATNQYADTTNQVCVTCNVKCATCTTSSTNCTSCANNLALNGSTCICSNSVYDSGTNTCKSCSSSQIYDSTNGICVNCTASSNCLTCQDLNNLGVCTSCPTGYVFNSPVCLTACPAGKYADSNLVCQSCNSLCQQCVTNSTTCTACNSPLVLSNSSCVCSTGFYNSTNNTCFTCATNQVPDYTNNTCVNCNSSCKTCQDSSNLTVCTSCTSPSGLYSSTCVNPCPAGTYIDTNQVCQTCNSSCATCSTSSTNCLTCKSTFTLQGSSCVCVNSVLNITSNTCVACAINQVYDATNKVCVNCDSNCLSCQDKNNLSVCTSCNGSQVLYNGTCVTSCPSGTYLNTSNVCVTCNSNCLTCQTTSTNCLTCSSPLVLQGTSCGCTTGFLNSTNNTCTICTSSQVPDYVNQKCVDCSSNCLTCQDSSNTSKCLTCASPNALYNNVCMNPCPNGYYVDANQICQQCNSSCLTCKTTSTNCVLCPNTFTNVSGSCVCVNSLYDSTTNTCKTCSLNQILDTTNQKCVDCTPSCQSCLDLTHLSTCTSCLSPLVLYNGTCIASCPSGMYPDSGNVCRSCNIVCKECSNTSTQCTSCNSPLVLQGTTCICTSGFLNTTTGTCIVCAVNQVEDIVNQVCVNCNASCKTCQDSSHTSTCTSCQLPLVLYNSTCVASCPSGTYQDSNGVCQTCNANCVECATTSTNCTQCLSTQQLLNGVCICNQGFFDSTTKTCVVCSANQITDITLKKCWTCDSPCLTCQDKNNLNVCLSCTSPLVLYNQQCLSSCPNGYYLNSTSNTCQTCNSNCLTCKTTSTTCTSCSSPMVISSTICVCGSGLFQYNGQCVDSCPSGTARNYTKMTCDSCDHSCSTCRVPNDPTQCIQCSNGYQLSNGLCVLICSTGLFPDPNNLVCLPCSVTCATCVNSPSNCLTCPPPLIFMNNSCLTSCPSQYVNHYGTCIPIGSCDSSCIKCDTNGNCLSCPSGQMIQGKICVQSCGTGYYLVQVAGICQPCYKGCDQCTGPNQSDCSTYVDPVNPTTNSQSCYPSCLTCSGPDYDQCITCNQNRQIQTYYGKSIGSCVCEDGYTDYLLSACTAKPKVSLIKSMTISSLIMNGVVTAMSSSPAVLFFLIDAQQTLSYFRYVNKNIPLNFDEQISPLYYSHITPFIPNLSKTWLPKSDSANTPSTSQSSSRTLAASSQSNSASSTNYQLSSGNNRIFDNQKYPYFLINAFVIIIFQVAFWIVCWVMAAIVKHKVLKPIGMRIVNIFRYNAIILIVYLTISELSLLTFYQFTIMNWETSLEIVSSLFAIISLLYIIGICFLLYNIIITQREVNKNEDKFYLLFGLFKEKHTINRYYPIILFLRKIIASMIYAFIYSSPEAQGILMIILYLPFWAYMISRNPFSNFYSKVTSVITEFFMLFCHLYLLVLCLTNSNQDLVSLTDLLIVLIASTLIVYTILGGLAIVGFAYLKIKEYRSRYLQKAKIYPYQGVVATSSKKDSGKLDYLSNSNKDDDNSDQLSALSITQQNMTQAPLKSQNDSTNMNIINFPEKSNHLQSVSDMSISYNNKLMNTSQNQQSRQFDIIDEQSNDDELSSAQRYNNNFHEDENQHDSHPKSHSQENEEKLEFSFRSRLEGIKEQDNEDGSIQFSDSVSYAQRKNF